MPRQSRGAEGMRDRSSAIRFARRAALALALVFTLTSGASAASAADWVIAPTGQHALPFSEGFAAVGLRWHYVGRDGAELYPAGSGDRYPTRGANAFSEGLALLYTTRNTPLSNYILPSGEKLFEQDLSSGGNFSEGLAYASWDGFSGYIRTDGQPAFSLPEELLIPQGACFHEGRAPVLTADSGLYGSIDKSGATVIPPAFRAAGPFSGGLAAVQTADGLWGYIDREGAFVLEPVYERASTFSEGRAWVQKAGATGIIDESGAFTPVPTELSITPEDTLYLRNFGETGEISSALFQEGFSVVREGELYGLVDRSGTHVISPRFSSMGNVREGLFAGCLEGQWGLYDTTGALVFAWDSDPAFDPENPEVNRFYTRISAPSEGLFAAAVGEDGAESSGYLRSPLYSPSPWAEAELAEAFGAGVVPHEISYHLQRSITRREFCALLAKTLTRLHGEAYLPAPADTFCDTDDQSVRILAGLGIVDGVGDGRFEPDAPLTREQAAAILVRAAEQLGLPCGGGDLSGYADADQISEYARRYVAALQSLGVMGGGDGLFDPRGDLTREQAVLTACRLHRVAR